MAKQNRRRIVVLGAGGRDFHNFNVLLRDDPACEVLAFAATQIPFQAGRCYPSSLAGPLYPKGIKIVGDESLPDLIGVGGAEEVMLAYSDLSHREAMCIASRILAQGADLRLVAAESTMLRSSLPVVSVCAVRTGCGKSPVTRYLCRRLLAQGRSPVVVRHPMAYGNLEGRAVQSFRHKDDLDLFDCTLEEREEFEPLLLLGVPVFAGVDYARILPLAEKAGDLLIWDGGNNDTPFFRSDLEIVLVDALRPGDEAEYFPGLVNLLRADVVVIAKADVALPEDLTAVEAGVRQHNPSAPLLRGALRISVDRPERLRDCRVAVVEDGPTLTHGGMAYGAATVAARRFGVAEIVDPRPAAVGSVAAAFRDYPHLQSAIPALGYSDIQLDDLRDTLAALPCDIILSATPVDLGRLLPLGRELVRVSYEFEEMGGDSLLQVVEAALIARDSEP